MLFAESVHIFEKYKRVTSKHLNILQVVGQVTGASKHRQLAKTQIPKIKLNLVTFLLLFKILNGQ